jgi:ABC-2 type transport system permease protein
MKRFSSRAFRAGSYCAIVTAIVLAVAIALNLVVGALPTSLTQFDTTSTQLYTLSDQTEEIVGNLTQDVTVYYLVQGGTEDSTIEKILDRYDSLSDKLTVTAVDPIVHPTFASQYTSDQQQNNSLIVVSGTRSRYVPYSDIYVYDYSAYFSTGQVSTSFDLEGTLTSAIDYVTMEDLPTMAVLEGHGELDLPTSLLAEIEKQNIEVEDLSLLSADAVPDGIDCVLIYSPTRDISAEETQILLNYLENGGGLLLVTDYTDEETPNLDTLSAAYGLSRVDGLVMEGDANYCLRGYAHYLLPSIQTHAITQPLIDGGYYALFPVAQGLVTTEEVPDGVSVTELLTTSDTAYSKLAAYASTTTDWEDGDINGPFAVAAAATKSVDDGTARFVWFTTSYAFEDNANQAVSGGNFDLFLNALGWMCEHDSAVSIHSKSLDQVYLTLTTSSARTWTIVFVFTLPALFIGLGIVVWIRRRARR